jgi:hypothetical protein
MLILVVPTLRPLALRLAAVGRAPRSRVLLLGVVVVVVVVGVFVFLGAGGSWVGWVGSGVVHVLLLTMH